MKQITIYDLLPLLKNGWVAMDEDGDWCWFDKKPHKRTGMWIWGDLGNWCSLTRALNIAPFDGDWKDSLIKVEHKCTSSGQVKEHIIHVEDFSLPHPIGFMSEGQLKRMFEHKEEE